MSLQGLSLYVGEFQISLEKDVVIENKRQVEIPVPTAEVREAHLNFTLGMPNKKTAQAEFKKACDAAVEEARKGLPAALKAKKRREHLNALANAVMVFVDRGGEIVQKESGPMSTHLVMRFRDKHFFATFGATQTVASNGSCWVNVKYKRELVFSAHGNFMAAAFNVTARTYKPGEWEKRFPKVDE